MRAARRQHGICVCQCVIDTGHPTHYNSRALTDTGVLCCFQLPKQSDTVALATTSGFVPRRLERENIQDFLAKKREIFLVQVGPKTSVRTC